MVDVSTASPPVLSVKELKVQIGRPQVAAVRGIDFNLWPGEILGLAGESGSGKSVTALALTRLLAPSSQPRYQGSVMLKDGDGNLLDFAESRLRRVRGSSIGYVFQEPSSSFNPVFTIQSHLDEVLKVSGLPSTKREAAIRQALEEVGIEPVEENLKAYPGSFSGGMLQRLAIACAIAPKPDILIADEPTTALDTSTQSRIVELLLRLNHEHGTAILFISHNLGLLKQVANRLLVMRDGLIVEQGDAAEVLYNPQNSYTRNLVSSIPKLV